MGLPTQAQEQTAKLDTIVVTTAGGYEQNIADAAATISVITAEELQKKSYSDVTDALKNVPGVFVQGGGTNQTVSIRGMGSAYTLFLIDGRPMNDGSLLTTNGGIQGASVNFLPPIESIERIEIIRGPSSSLYGSDAMGGVINIITKKHQDRLTASIRTEYIKADKSNDVNNDATNTSLYVNAPLIDNLLSLQVTAGLQTIDESSLQKNTAETGESEPDFQKTNIGTKFVYTPDDKNTITAEYKRTQQERTHNPGKSYTKYVSATGSKVDIGGEDFILSNNNYYPAFDTGEKDKNGNAIYQSDVVPNTRTYSELEKNSYSLTHDGDYDNLKLTSYIQYDKDENNAITGRTVNGITNPGGILFETLTANTQGTYFFDQHTLTVGGRYLKENLEDGTSNQNVEMAGQVTKMDRYQWSLFAEDTWSVTDKLALTLSGRLDENEFFGDNFSPKAYAVYKATDSFTFKGGVISGYKAPSLRNSSPEYMLNSMGGAIMPNPDLKPETSLTYETGFAYENQDLGLLASLMFYQTDFKDKITRSSRMQGSQDADSDFYKEHPELPYNANGYTYNYNVDEAQIRGIELTTDYQITDNVKYRHSYTYTNSEQKSGQYEGKPLNDIPKHMFNAGLDWDVNDKLLLWSQLNYRGKTVGNTSDVQTPEYTFVDVGAVYKHDEKLQFSTGIYNLTNKNVLEDGNSWVLDGRRYNFALNYKF
ncbi:TonB-dependent receptor [Acinetobacter wanghuae]|uniref:TonB-dependent receptor n=2 Tax=Acinetobacter wanghuae TaxID=2662362 RepID=A0A5Q0P532_9GAMM|nr:TonB-dependent receptor [Acinetobacter wanghuae]QGA12285.1 TonB-dependent receptor [Acinetobacter wanghuae]